MNYKNKLMGLSLIMCAAFSSCTDEMENGGGGKGPGDHRISFAVSTQGQANDTRSGLTSGTRELGSAEMQGKLDGKPVYISAELSDGFPGDNRLMTRGTQVTTGSQVDEFTVLAYTIKTTGYKDTRIMDFVKVTKNSTSNVWTPQEAFYWPTGRNMGFYALYPCEATGMTIHEGIDTDEPFFPVITYEVPDDVSEQQDIMMGINPFIGETTTVPLTFKHLLTAVKFKTSDDIPACTIKSITLKNVKYKGAHKFETNSYDGTDNTCPWNTRGIDYSVIDTASTGDFTLTVNKEITENTETDLTEEGKTFFMMPQTFGDDARLEVLLDMDGTEQTLGVNLKDISKSWNLGKTVTYRISHQDNIDLSLSKDVFVSSGDDAVIYVKSSLDWECTMSDPNGITGSAEPALCKPALKGTATGVKSDSFDNDNSKLTIETIQQTGTDVRKGKVKLTFTFPSKPGKTVEKEVTLTSQLMIEYPEGSDIWYKLTKGSITGEKLVTTDTPTIPDNAEFATAIAKVVGQDVTYSRELVATRVLNDDDDTQCLTKFAIRRAKADGSTTTVTFSVITLENTSGTGFDEKNFMTWGDTYYPIGSTWVVNKDNYDVKTNTESLGQKSVWESIAIGQWAYNQSNFSFLGNNVFMNPGYYTMQKSNLTIYSIEKVSN